MYTLHIIVNDDDSDEAWDDGLHLEFTTQDEAEAALFEHIRICKRVHAWTRSMDIREELCHAFVTDPEGDEVASASNPEE